MATCAGAGRKGSRPFQEWVRGSRERGLRKVAGSWISTVDGLWGNSWYCAPTRGYTAAASWRQGLFRLQRWPGRRAVCAAMLLCAGRRGTEATVPRRCLRAPLTVTQCVLGLSTFSAFLGSDSVCLVAVFSSDPLRGMCWPQALAPANQHGGAAPEETPAPCRCLHPPSCPGQAILGR